jgi:hypothetical protein
LSTRFFDDDGCSWKSQGAGDRFESGGGRGSREGVSINAVTVTSKDGGISFKVLAKVLALPD